MKKYKYCLANYSLNQALTSRGVTILQILDSITFSI